MESIYVLLTVLGVACLANSIWVTLVYSELRAMKLSTHRVTYMPLDPSKLKNGANTVNPLKEAEKKLFEKYDNL